MHQYTTEQMVPQNQLYRIHEMTVKLRPHHGHGTSVTTLINESTTWILQTYDAENPLLPCNMVNSSFEHF
jgi:hypothetical protein